MSELRESGIGEGSLEGVSDAYADGAMYDLMSQVRTQLGEISDQQRQTHALVRETAEMLRRPQELRPPNGPQAMVSMAPDLSSSKPKWLMWSQQGVSQSLRAVGNSTDQVSVPSYLAPLVVGPQTTTRFGRISKGEGSCVTASVVTILLGLLVALSPNDSGLFLPVTALFMVVCLASVWIMIRHDRDQRTVGPWSEEP